MNHALIYVTLTIVLLLTSFQVHSQSEENELPSCMGYDFSPEQALNIMNGTDRIEDALEIFRDVSEMTQAEFVAELGYWAVFADSAWLRFYNDPAECFEYVEHERLYRELIGQAYALTTQMNVFITLTNANEFQRENISTLFSATVEQVQGTTAILVPIMDVLNEARRNQP